MSELQRDGATQNSKLLDCRVCSSYAIGRSDVLALMALGERGSQFDGEVSGVLDSKLVGVLCQEKIRFVVNNEMFSQVGSMFEVFAFHSEST